MEELREELNYKKGVLCKLASMAQRMGNKDWQDTPAIKKQVGYIKELEAKLKAKQEEK